MVQYICIDRQMNKYREYEYALRNISDPNDTNTYYLCAEELKEHLRRKDGEVVNLRLTVDNRLYIVNERAQTNIEDDRRRIKQELNARYEDILEQFADSVITSLSTHSATRHGNILQIVNANTKGYENTFVINMNSSLVNKSVPPVRFICKYGKSVQKVNDIRYNVIMYMSLLGIKVGAKQKVYEKQMQFTILELTNVAFSNGHSELETINIESLCDGILKKILAVIQDVLLSSLKQNPRKCQEYVRLMQETGVASELVARNASKLGVKNTKLHDRVRYIGEFGVGQALGLVSNALGIVGGGAIGLLIASIVNVLATMISGTVDKAAGNIVNDNLLKEAALNSIDNTDANNVCGKVTTDNIKVIDNDTEFEKYNLVF